MRKSETIKHHNVRISEILEFQKRQNIRTREYQNQNMRTSESDIKLKLKNLHLAKLLMLVEAEVLRRR